MVRKHLLFLAWLSFALPAWSQGLETLSLAEAYAKLEANYPALQDGKVLQQLYEEEVEQVEQGRLPKLFLKADGRLQSQSTSLDAGGAMLPFEIDQPLVSAKGYAEAQYSILNGGMVEAQKSVQLAKLKADQQGIEVQRYQLRQRVNQLFVGISLLRGQTGLIELSLADLQARKEPVAAAVRLGAVVESELTRIEVREIELQSRKDALDFQLKGMLGTLSELLGVSLSPALTLGYPELPEPQQVPVLNRPELQLFDLQRESILAQSSLIDAKRKPKLSAYAQAGVGYPNPLNILDNNVAPYGLVGAQFSWEITGRKTAKSQKEVLQLQTHRLDNAESTFEFNLRSQEASYLAEVVRLERQIERDEQIADLQARILQQLRAQLEEGVITSADYLSQVNAELAARQNLVLHQVELLKVQLDFYNNRQGF